MEVALFGNPNTGKTSLFNILTGSYEYVGNWSGVTVEKKVGILKESAGRLIDLPGIYSLNPLSKDEGIATQFLLNESFSVALNIVDASQLERNLHLTIQLLEFGKPVVIGLNMIDVAKSRGIHIDEKALGKKLGASVIPIVARTGKKCQFLSKQLTPREEDAEPLHIDYGEKVEESIDQLVSLMPEDVRLNKRWLSLQFLEGNKVVRENLTSLIDKEQLNKICTELESQIIIEKDTKSIKQYLYAKRQQFISEVVAESVEKGQTSGRTFTQTIDAVVTNKFLGIPIFLLLMFLVFTLTFNWLGTPLSDGLDAFISGPLTDWLKAGLTNVHATPFIQSVILDGIVAGVGGVLVFVPQIFILFFFISLIEDSGYMARVAMVMDRVMESVGLNGKAFIPLIIGFGCNVPGIMAARTIEQPKERLLTTLLTPLMSCSARLSVYSLFVAAFFEKHQALIVLSLYVLGIIVALVLAKIFTFFIKSEGSVFVIELPPYRIPQARTLLRSTWDKGKGFVRKAGTFIFGGTVAIWFLSYAGPHGFDVPIDESFMAVICGYIAPLLAPIGFGTWQAAGALVTGFLAKEVVVSTMNVLYFVPDGQTLTGIISHFYTPLQAYSFMVFILLYVPCLSTVAVIQKEAGSKKWTAFSIGYALVVAYLLSLVVYQGGQWLGLH
ncbi:ferrous iron transport protein B [Scopulibacillus darangshiensis]|uniref:Ferrous iron transport protein B n=1 Tax=Scopulibacillus darangshiensis TaxID=442528 RepID=A0A4R2P2T1_9BACL|nr:ferrous iron transport protein B [Scopulibacillus darangshiensis]TCP28942.1 ferrous iron transport protein B [Scopulibacillus darangshiensis]